MDPTPDPPRVLRGLLAWVLPPGNARDGLLGDLDELYGERVRTGRTAAYVWYAGQLVSAVIHYRLRPAWAWAVQGEGRGMGGSGIGRISSMQSWALTRRPGFAGVVVLTLALGIGASTAIFSVSRSPPPASR